MPSFRQVLTGISEAWTERRDEIVVQAARVTEAIARDRAAHRSLARAADGRGRTGLAMTSLRRSFDARWGGFGGAPKFPQPMTLEFLLRQALRGEPDALEMVVVTLDRMASGGIYDQVGGGFARYATDAAWHVPHFEKMLYDNAQLLQLYARAWQVTRNEDVPACGRGDRATTCCARCSIPRAASGRRRTPTARASRGGSSCGRGTSSCRSSGSRSRRASARRRRATGRARTCSGDRSRHRAVAPGVRARRRRAGRRDRGRTTACCSRRGRARVRPGDRRQGARRLERHGDPRPRRGRPRPRRARLRRRRRPLRDVRARATCGTSAGRLLRSWREGRRRGPGLRRRPRAAWRSGCLTLYETTCDLRWFVEARALADELIRLLRRPRARRLLPDGSRRRRARGAARRSSTTTRSRAGTRSPPRCCFGWRCSRASREYERIAASALRLVRDAMGPAPTGFGHALCAARPVPGTGSGGRDRRETRTTERTRNPGGRGRRRRSDPTPCSRSGSPDGEASATVPLLADRVLRDDRPTAYVCRRFTCRLPVTDVVALREQLAEG